MDSIYEIESFVSDFTKVSVSIKEYDKKHWLVISKHKKWAQDGKFHFYRTLNIELDQFKSQLLPGINEMCQKVQSCLPA